MTPEKKVKAKCTRILKKLHQEDPGSFYYFFPQAGPFGRAGVPDIIISARGRFTAIECKAGKNGLKKLTKLQAFELEKISQSGGAVTVVDESTTPSELEAWLREAAL
tara:strand:+ start:413 stop:733 length:321 start_codon:yes stop_codon:yes gene_type:complete